ncbi:hypothetical protein [Amycolatopsis sp. PS_44_ISF1]|uniref:hypothetical protein n=1 Tax=Amycolatopsis sp. PS_44_ISF1 TaxID=2974917 RepID=UPI0028E04349|nr:hypothetical protein [Amycolatopsis sp. PS_44_ISF1]MDT8909528.1 hypothetical protein [Amycolatopsis sp. PS_44_ISF1]
MRKRAVFVAVAAIGAIGAATVAAVAGPATAAADGQAPARPGPAVTVQLNLDTAAQHGMVNEFQRGEANVALAQCPGAGAGSASFSSPVLFFEHYNFGPHVGVEANVSADALLLTDTPAGRYPLTVNCGGNTYRATFTVPAAQVDRVPAGAAKAGDGSLAE